MKPIPSLMMIFLTLLLAVVLGCTLMLICLSSFGAELLPPCPVGGGDSIVTSGEETQAETAVPTTVLTSAETTVPQTTATSSTAEATTSVTTEATTEASTQAPEPILPENGDSLSYVSNGDGTCKIVGIGECKDACVVIPQYSPEGERVIEIAPRAFYGCSGITAVQIPKSVSFIGELAFAACERLVYLSVDTENPYYCDVDGILYSAGCTTLICYPPLRAGREVTIHAVTNRILEMAFYNCPYLESVRYMGSYEDWDAMIIGGKNYSLTSAAMTFVNEE